MPQKSKAFVAQWKPSGLKGLSYSPKRFVKCVTARL